MEDPRTSQHRTRQAEQNSGSLPNERDIMNVAQVRHWGRGKLQTPTFHAIDIYSHKAEDSFQLPTSSPRRMTNTELQQSSLKLRQFRARSRLPRFCHQTQQWQAVRPRFLSVVRVVHPHSALQYVVRTCCWLRASFIQSNAACYGASRHRSPFQIVPGVPKDRNNNPVIHVRNITSHNLSLAKKGATVDQILTDSS